MTQVAEPTTRRKAARASAAGQVVSWSAHVGQQVTTGETLGTFLDEFGEVEITAPCSGVLGKMVVQGARVVEGSPLCYVEPATSRQDGPQADRVDRPASPPQAAPRSRGEARRGVTLPPAPVEELSIEPPIIRRPKKSAGADKVKLRSLYLLPSQERAIKRDVATWALDDEDRLSTNDSEIVRALIDLYQSLPPAKRRVLIEGYK